MKLTKAARKALPGKVFAGPGRSFPIEDSNHAHAAITGASRSFHAGNISRPTMERIQAKARAKLRGL